jgi:hypothetical protein
MDFHDQPARARIEAQRHRDEIAVDPQQFAPGQLPFYIFAGLTQQTHGLSFASPLRFASHTRNERNQL